MPTQRVAKRNGQTPTPKSDNRVALASQALARDSAEGGAPASEKPAPATQTDIQIIEKALPEGSVRVALKRGQAQELAELESAIAAEFAHLQTLRQSLNSLHRFAISGHGHDASQFQCVAINVENKDTPELLFVPIKKHGEFKTNLAHVAGSAQR